MFNIKNEMPGSDSVDESSGMNMMMDASYIDDEYVSSLEKQEPYSDDCAKKYSRGGNRESIWKSDSCRMLIELVKKNYEILQSGKSYEKKFVWEEISQSLQNSVPGVNDTQVKAKWYTLRLNYVKYIESDEKGKAQIPDHMDLLQSFVKDRSLIPQSAQAVEYTKKCPRGGARQSFWSSSSRKKLIELVKEDYETIISGKSYEKELVWDKITRKMREVVPELNDIQIKGKWNNIRYSVIKYIELEDRGRIKRPEHIDLLLSFLKEDRTIRGRAISAGLLKEDSSDQEYSESSPRKRRSVRKYDYDDNVYSLLCQEISEPKHEIDDSHVDYSSAKRQKIQNNKSHMLSDSPFLSSSTVENLLREIAKQIRSFNERDKVFKHFIKKTLKNLEELEDAREEREIAREERERKRESRLRRRGKANQDLQNR